MEIMYIISGLIEDDRNEDVGLFDIKATGLKSSGRPRISEIYCVAINTHPWEKLYSFRDDNFEVRTFPQK